jgi:hypothetical protein
VSRPLCATLLQERPLGSPVAGSPNAAGPGLTRILAAASPIHPFYDDRTIVSATVALRATVQIGTMHWLNPRAEAARFGQRAKA